MAVERLMFKDFQEHFDSQVILIFKSDMQRCLVVNVSHEQNSSLFCNPRTNFLKDIILASNHM